YKDDIKEGCVGYLKSEEREGKFKLELQVKNIPDTLTGEYPIRLQSATGWSEAGTLVTKEGNGKWTGSMTKPILKAEIIISDISMIKGQSKKASAHETWGTNPRITTEEEESEQTLQNRKETGEKENELQVKAEPAEKELGRQVKAVPVEKELKAQAETELRESEAEKWTMPENAPIYESKWEQLLATYEQIHPYGDNRVYVKLEPKDFVILPSGYQHLVNNSFLLHGFYNYRYLILGKEKDFYLGVPGVFYEREKMVALMFGFEAFKCEGGNAKEGKFGYYLRKVEL
ncbi:MAG: hypothetical protein K2H31_02640, partial [Lachnospiraceae bacterium]|nr:hypothetical protein [Lachnospiraceae bacterium]